MCIKIEEEKIIMARKAAATTTKKAAETATKKVTETKAAAATKAAAEKAVAEVEKEVEKVAAETKAAAEKVAKKATTRKTAPKATVTVEAAGRQFDISAIADKAVAAYKAMNEKAAVKTVDVYVKPEEGVAYYVINGEGSADFKVEL
jgi:hypothetical protein